MSNYESLTPKQRGAISALLTAPNVVEAAKIAGVSTASIYRWLDESAFSAALSEAQGRAIDAAVRSLTALAERAIGVIQAALDDPAASHGVRLRAAGLALEMLLRLRDSHDVEQRLAALEGRDAESN